MLVLDSGNALYKARGPVDAASRARADFIVDTLGELGTQAMVPGTRDLLAGIEALKARAAQAKLTLISANLVGADGKPSFPASVTLTAGGVKVGLVGATAADPVPGGGSASPALPLVLAEAKRLKGKVDVLVVLAAVPQADALQLASESKGLIDLVLQSHEARGAGSAQRSEGTYVLASGERGRQLGALTLQVQGKGPLVDLGEAERAKQLLGMLEGQVATVKQRIAASPDKATQAELRKSLQILEESRKRHQKQAVATRGARSFAIEWLNLGATYADDPALKAKVEKIEPPGTAAH